MLLSNFVKLKRPTELEPPTTMGLLVRLNWVENNKFDVTRNDLPRSQGNLLAMYVKMSNFVEKKKVK